MNRLSRLVLCLLPFLLTGPAARSQFVAFNDHAPGTIGVSTHPHATTWNILGNAPGTTGPLKDIQSGLELPILLTITRSGTVNGAPNAGAPNPDTPLSTVFAGYVDFLGTGNADAVVQITGSSTITYTFSGLNPDRTYSFKGSAVRGGSGGTYPQRWSLFQLNGALSFTSAHTAGCFTNGLAANQVAVNTGINVDGDMADWENIVPARDGTFSVLTTQYTGPITSGGTANGPYGYGLSGFRLQENRADTPVSITRQPTNIVAGELSSADFTVAVDGSPFPSLQWYRNDLPLVGATGVTCRLPVLYLTNNGDTFNVVAQNVISQQTHTATSKVATLTVIPDTQSPLLLEALGIGLDQARLRFSERITPSTATNPANYLVTAAGGSVPVLSAALEATQTNIILSFAALREGTLCTVQVRNLADHSAAANVVSSNAQASFLISSYTPAAIGESFPRGSQVGAGNGYDISGGGAGILGTGDQCEFHYQLSSGDFDVRVRLEALTLADAWSQAGLMLREDLSSGARSASVLATPSISGTFFEARNTTNGTAIVSGSFPVNYPNTWLRLKREGSKLTGFAGFDGSNWAPLGSVTMSLPDSLYLGFFVSSYTTNLLATAAFRDFGPVTQANSLGSPPYERPGQSRRSTSLVISEIMYHPARSNLAFVEIFNSQGEAQDLSGYQLSGSVQFTFPSGTMLPGGGFAVVARDPNALETAYALSGVYGPYTNNLPNGSGTVRLLSQAGAVFLEVNYSDQPPWPVSADGAGHSLVLSRPSYGEDSPVAWTPSDAIGGSPGRIEPYTPEPLHQVRINEFLAHTDDPELDYVELYNYSASPLNLSGCILTDDPETNRFVVPAGTTIPANGFVHFTQVDLGFSLNAAGETLYLKAPNQQRILDTVRFGGQENGVSTGRCPDGSERWYRLSAKTPGQPNGSNRHNDVVINEIMYAPISLDDDEQYVELHNAGSKPVDLSGWKFVAGINYTFPPNTVMAPGGYLVVARNAARLQAIYPTLNAGNLVGDFGGRLAHNGERLALAMPDTILSTNNSGVVTTTHIDIVVEEVEYQNGGRWPRWADGGGSSLELMDPRADRRLAGNWADSDETHKAPWTLFSATGTIDNGRTSSILADQLQVLLQGSGECLIDDVKVLDSLGNNRITNSTFESGAGGWTAEGTESTSSLETTEGYQSSRSYHVRAIERGDNQINRIRTPLSSALPINTTNVTIQCAARWLKGHPELLLRLRGNWLECVAELALPVRPGTPGARNSRWVANAPPALAEVKHSPVLPQVGQPIVVTARATDPDGLATMLLNYRIDPATTYAGLAMRDDGNGGDGIAGDGVYTATIPGLANAATIAFYVQAADRAPLPATATFPNDAPVRECLVRVGEKEPTGNFPVYRLWMTQSTLNRWASRNKLDNTPNDVTFVLGNDRVIYNASALYAGSPHIAPSYCGPTCGRCGYSISFPADDPFLGDRNLVLDWPGGHGNETTAIQEQMGYWVANRLGLPYSHRYFIRLHINGVTDDARSQVFEAVWQPGGSFVRAWSPQDPDGPFFKIDQAFEFSDAGGNLTSPGPMLRNYTTTGGRKKREAYRWNFDYRSTDRVNDYTDIFSLVDALNSTRPEPYTSATEALVDVEEWMGIFATEHIIANFDAYGHAIGKNMYAFLPSQGKWQLYMFDLDWLMLVAVGANSTYGPSTAPLFNSEDPTIAAMYSHPPFVRAYWRAVERAINGPLNSAECDPVMDAKYRSLLANRIAWCDGQKLTGPAAVKNWFRLRRSALQAQLAKVSSPLAIDSVSVTNNIARISGTAPIAAQTLWFNGGDYPLTWTSVSNWIAMVPLKPGLNQFQVVGVDWQRHPIPGLSQLVSATYSGALPSPAGQLVVNEIHCSPASPDTQFVELFNTSSEVSFDLSGWEFRGLSYTFPHGSTIAPRQFLVLARSRSAFAAAYGATKAVFDTFSGTLQAEGETLTLVIPGTDAGPDAIVARVRYASSAPWPAGLQDTGSSLQTIDARQDNWRVANWAPAAPTPGSDNLVVAALPAFPTLWINEVQAANVTGITNRAGSRTPWLELHNPSTNTVSLGGLHLSNAYTNLSAWAFPANAFLRPGEFKIIFADGLTGLSTTGELHTSFSLHPSAGTLLLSWERQDKMEVLDYVTYTNLSPNRSFGSFPDAQMFSRQEFFYVTPGGTNNAASAPLTVRINEIMAGNTRTLPNPTSGKYSDWFELYNYGSTTANLAGFFLTDNLTNRFQFQIPSGYTIPPHGFLLVWADGKSTNGTPDLHLPFKLNKDGESLGLYGADGVAVDYITYPAQLDDISQGRFPDGADSFHFMSAATPRTNNVVPNLHPAFLPVSDRWIILGQTLAFSLQATNAETPPQTLRFTLGPTAPPGATLNPLNGLFVWSPTSAPSTNLVTVLVTDDGNPPLTATASFAVTVLSPPALRTATAVGSQLNLVWTSLDGQTYQLEYADQLAAPSWSLWGGPIQGTGSELAMTVDLAPVHQRFYRLRLQP
jgi:hypothetical protein